MIFQDHYKITQKLLMDNKGFLDNIMKRTKSNKLKIFKNIITNCKVKLILKTIIQIFLLRKKEAVICYFNNNIENFNKFLQK